MELTLPYRNTKKGTEYLNQCNSPLGFIIYGIDLQVSYKIDKYSMDDVWALMHTKYDAELSLQEKAFMDMSA